MNDNAGDGRGPRGRSRILRLGVLAAAVASITLLVAACGGAGSPAAQKSTNYQKALAYARCMRSHGVPDFPDPTSQGTFEGLSHAVPSPQTLSAMNTCRHLLPNGGGQLTAAQQQQALRQNLKYSACMRSHGYPDFPDPTVPPGGGVSIQLPPGIDADSPQFQSAHKTCQAVMNSSGGGGS
jgi:hypothetical protein